MNRGLKHGVFAGNLVGVGWYAELVFDAADNVKIGQTGFDHHHIRTFLNVEGDFVQGFVGIGGVHLVGFLVGFAQIAGTANRISERAVKSGGVFGGIRHDAGVDVSRVF